MPKNKHPHTKEEPSSIKKARRKERPESTEHETIVWSLGLLFRSGKWGWNDIRNTILWNNVLAKIKHFESMTWAQIKKGVHNHPILKSQLCRGAQRELDDKRLDDIDELFQLGLSGTERIWGIRIGRVFQVLWWDPKHTVCPSSKKYS